MVLDVDWAGVPSVEVDDSSEEQEQKHESVWADVLHIGLLPPVLAGAASLLLRAEVVNREDGIKHRWVVTVDFGPVFRVPADIAKLIVVLLKLDLDGSFIIPANIEPVHLIVFVLTQFDVVAANFASNSFSLPILPESFALAIPIRPFLHSGGRVNHLGVLTGPVQT